jgi:DNA replication and repair protein RecF
MYIDLLKASTYRNFQNVHFRPGPGLNVIWGDNAQGKTNILEMLYLLGTLKSFKGGKNVDFIQQGKEEAHLQARIKKIDVENIIALDITPGCKKVLLNGKSVKSCLEYFSCLRPIIFSPEEVLIARGAPGTRRAMLDRAIFQADPKYLELVRAYDVGLRQRNRALLEKLPPAELFPWTERLILQGAAIRHERYQFLQQLIPKFRQAYQRICGAQESADMHYQAGDGCSKTLQEKLRRELAPLLRREMRLGQTLAGPHRDDIEFSVAGRPVRQYGSQGQQRSCILAFKTAQVMDIEERSGEAPILLLDDLNSELDRHRQDFYFEFLLSRPGQVFITTTDPQPFVARTLENASFFRVKNGRITPDTEMRRQ